MKYSAFLPDVLPQLAADPSEPVTLNAIKNACIELCATSWVWRATLDPIDVEANVSTYDLLLPAGADVAIVLSARLADVPLEIRSGLDLDNGLPTHQKVGGTPKYITQVDPGQIILAPFPLANATEALAVSVALQPSRSVDYLPNWLGTRYWDTIAAGALSRLLLMPEKPWTNPAVGAYMRDTFTAGVNRAREDGVNSVGRAPLRVTPQH